MKKVLLSAALLSLMMAGNAQVLTYGFEDGDSGKPETTNWENFSGSLYGISDGAKYSGANGLEVSTDVTCNTWERVYSFQQLALEENKSYRVSFMMKATAGISINTGLFMGYWNCDNDLQAGTESSPASQTKNFAATGEWQKISYLAWNPTKEIMQALYKKAPYKNLDDYPVMPDNYYLRLAFTGAGSYFIDDVLIEEASIAGVRYNGQALTIDFGYATNLAELGKDGIVNLDTDVVTVNVNGTDKTPSAIEIQKDGCLYIFLAEEDALAETDAVKVSFKNPGDIKYSTSVAPNCFTEPNCAVLDFENEAATYDGLLSAASFADAEPELLSTVPVDGSFEIDPTTKEFSFTFDHMMDANWEDTKAYLDDEELVIKSTESSYTLVFERTSTEDLGKGTHTLKIEGVATDAEYGLGMWNEGIFATSEFEVGSVVLSQTIYTDLFTTLMSGQQDRTPDNWTVFVKGDAANPWTGGEAWYSTGTNCRNQNIGDLTAYYLCDRDGYTYMQYGDVDTAALVIPAGKIEFSVLAVGHSAASTTIEFRLEDMEGHEVLHAQDNTTISANECTSADAASKITGRFENPTEQRFILKVHNIASDVWSQASRVLGFKVRSYIETEGDKDESVILLEDKTFGNADDNCAPKAGSGWALYQDGAKRDAGANYNYNGTRIFKLGIKNLSVGYYTNGSWNNGSSHYIIYGEGGEYGEEGAQEPVLTLPEGRLQITYYAANWKTNERTLYFQLLNEENKIVAERADKIVMDPHMDGNRNASVETNKIQFNQTIPAAGNYKIKFGGDGEMFIGNITIEKPGSSAALYHKKLNSYIAEANAELELSADAMYDGTIKSALSAAVEKYSKEPNGMHTPDEYNAACAELESLTKALAARRLAIIAFNNDIATLGEKLQTILGTKYENVEAIKSLIEAYNTYATVDPSTLENEELLPLQAKVTAGIGQVDKIKNIVDNMYTKQINDLLNAIALHAENLDNEFATSWIEKGEEAISDDQAVAGELQKILTAVIYKKIANGYNFQVIDEETAAAYPDSLQITGYVANNMIYTTMSATNAMNKRFTVEEACEAFPGWNITEGTVSNIWWWENPVVIDEVTPAIQDGTVSIRNVGGNAFKVNQVLNNLPAGSFTLSMKTADCSNIVDVSKTYEKKDSTLAWSNSVVYAKIGADSIACEANYGAGQVWRGAAATILPGIKTEQALESGVYTLTMTIGADMNCTSDAAQVDDTDLFMTGKMEGFDYAAAAEAILNGLTNGIEVVKREDTPTSVVYYNMNGQQSQAAQGVNLKVERYSDGYVVVRKVVIK